jgi:tRNA pseudouridine13 synthase
VNVELDAGRKLLDRLAQVPFLTRDIPPVQGELKQTADDFVVEEIPAYPPSGAGEHLYLWVEKRDLNTHDAVTRLSRLLGARSESAGYAGLKDKRAVTRQWLSFHHTATPAASDLESEGLRVLEVSRHVNKLRTGHLRGNRFTLRLAGVPEGHEAQASAALEHIARDGLPNYYGAQRFGHGGRNIGSAWAWIVEGGRAPQKPFLRKLFVSSLQSALFNAWLGQRLDGGNFLSVLAGDVLRKEESGGLFTCEDPAVDRERLRNWEISATGPMFGARMRAAEANAREAEEAILATYGVQAEHFERVQRSGEGTRRAARVRVDDVGVRRDGGDLELRFTLPRGSYATVLLAELTKTRDLTLGDDP